MPKIGSLSPPCILAGGQAFTLSLIGLDFVPGSVVRWNGSDRPSTFSTSGQISAQIPASDIAAVGTVAVTVFNPAPGGGISTTATFTIVGALSPSSVAVDPGGRFAYVAGGWYSMTCPEGHVSIYSINPNTGVLAAIGPPVDAGDQGTLFVTVDPSGKFVYTANDGGEDGPGSVSAFAINPATGTLTSTGTMNAPCAPPPSPGSCSPWSLAIHPSGKFVYVANEGGFSPTSVSMYAIDAGTGALTLKQGPMATAARAVAVAVDPSGRFAYVANTGSNNVSMYSINATTGALTSIGLIATGTQPASVAVDPSGKFAYVTNTGSNDVSMYSIDATTGALTSIGIVAAGTQPVSAAVDPSGKFAYVTNRGSNNVSMYMIGIANGTLTSIGTIAAESSPTSIAIHPSGKFAYVTNSSSNTVSMYSIDAATGTLSLIGTIGT